MNADAGLPIDSAQLQAFLSAAFRYADPATFISLRSFLDITEGPPFLIEGHELGNDVRTVLPAVERVARACAKAAEPIVFCPPLATFVGPKKATESDLANGLVLSVECDREPNAARKRLEALIGPATVVVASGGEWIDAATGEIQDKLHLHWRLNEPTKSRDDHLRLKQARMFAARLVGGDASNEPIVHPIRWPGSWHRKGQPKLTTIVILTDDEVDLGDALERLQEACDAAGHKPDGAAGSGASSGEERDTAELIQRVLTADDYHAPLTALAMRYMKGGMHDAQIVLTLRGVMQAVPEAIRDLKDGVAQAGRWQARYDDIPRAVRTARDKVAPVDSSTAGPSISILTRVQVPAPALPLHLFGPWWARWLEVAAAGANCPPDYVALPLLATASALIGNARWVRAWQGWVEPPVLWLASAGNPSSGKTPGASAVTRDVLRRVEEHMGRDYEAQLSKWKEEDAVAKAVFKQWEKDVAAAIKKKVERPVMPLQAISPTKPVRPRARVADATVEALAVILQGLPKGVLCARDELAGWLLNLSRYSGGSDRPFWLEAYVGGAMTVDRVKNPEPLFIPHLSVPLFGTIQPDRLEDALTGADDGLSARFLWSWPDARPFGRPGQSADTEGAVAALTRLADLAMAQNSDGKPMPSYVSLQQPAAEALEAFARGMQAEEENAEGLLKSALGKARGQALRLALVLHYLHWATAGVGPEPTDIPAEAMQAGITLMTNYFLPMARRVLGDASIPKEERNARTLARWIVAARPVKINVSAIRDDARLPGLRESDPVKAACSFLVEARWLAEPVQTGRGRPRGDYLVNQALWAVVAG